MELCKNIGIENMINPDGVKIARQVDSADELELARQRLLDILDGK